LAKTPPRGKHSRKTEAACGFPSKVATFLL